MRRTSFIFFMLLSTTFCSKGAKEEANEVSAYVNKTGGIESRIKIDPINSEKIDETNFKLYLASQLTIAQEMGEANNFFINKTDPHIPFSLIESVRVAITSNLKIGAGGTSETNEGSSEREGAAYKDVDGNGLSFGGDIELIGVKLWGEVANHQENGGIGGSNPIYMGYHVFGIKMEGGVAIGFKLKVTDLTKILAIVAGLPEFAELSTIIDDMDISEKDVEDDRYIDYSNDGEFSIPLNGILYDISGGLPAALKLAKNNKRVSNFTKHLYEALIPSLCSAQRGLTDGEVSPSCVVPWDQTIKNYVEWGDDPQKDKPFSIAPSGFCMQLDDPNEIMIYFPVPEVDVSRTNNAGTNVYFNTAERSGFNEVTLNPRPNIHLKSNQKMETSTKIRESVDLSVCDPKKGIMSAHKTTNFKANPPSIYGCSRKIINTDWRSGAVECQSGVPLFTESTKGARDKGVDIVWEEIFITHKEIDRKTVFTVKPQEYLPVPQK